MFSVKLNSNSKIMNIEIHQTILNIMSMLHKCGIWRKGNESKVLGWKLFILIFHACYVISMVSGGLLSENKTEFVFLTGGGIAYLIASVKLNYIVWKKEEILAFIYDQCRHCVADNEEFNKFNGKVNKLMAFSSVYLLSLTMSVLTLITFYLPIFSTNNSLPFNVWFPLDWKNNGIVYWIAYGFVSTNMITSIISICLNVLISYVMMNFTIKYQILGNQLKNMDPAIRNRRISEEEQNKLRLHDVIKIQLNIREY